jgi:bisphosphoglycerate-independent phosphoglycerate mutase (AlkP superfamily)
MGGNSECGHLWVRGDGTVLIQDTVMLDARITFVRAGPERAAVLAKRVPAHAP